MGTRRGMTRRTARKAYRGLPSRRRRSSGALTKVKQELQAEKRKMSALRKKSKAGNFVSGSGLKIGASLAIISGGALSGATDNYMPEVAGIDTSLILGGVLVGAGLMLSNSNQDISGILGCIGSGMLAASAADFTSGFLGESPAALEVAT